MLTKHMEGLEQRPLKMLNVRKKQEVSEIRGKKIGLLSQLFLAMNRAIKDDGNTD